MQRFIKRLLLFAGILAFYLGVNFFINRLIIQFQDLPIKSVTLLIVGDSHSRNALNPEFFNSAENISQTAEPYPLTYLKLKYILNYFKPDTLIVGFGHHNISGFNDEKFSDEAWSSEMFRRTYILRNELLDLHGLTVDKNELDNVYLRNMCLYPKLNHREFMGQYEGINRRDRRSVGEVIDSHYYYRGKEAGISEASISYADSIVALCRRNRITPILVGTPVTKEYLDLTPRYIKSRYEQEKARMKNSGVMVLDFTDLPLDADEYMNADHVNEAGSAAFTKQIIRILQGKE